ncbi:MAG: hypothetical protein LBE22_10930 [Azoarcus sp.]|jgi:membrane protein implicated in regulation of membrane protease activity|nr:hypothetical protein [Azoarcus sp.]
MSHRPLKIILYIVAGFFLSGISTMAFMAGLPLKGKLAIAAIFSFLALIALWSGFKSQPGSRRCRETGVVLLSVAAFDVFQVGMAISFFTSELFRQQYAQSGRDLGALYSDYATGFGFIVLLVALGFVFLWVGRRSATAKTPRFPAEPDTGGG